jgi:hypothetical protein
MTRSPRRTPDFWTAIHQIAALDAIAFERKFIYNSSNMDGGFSWPYFMP